MGAHLDKPVVQKHTETFEANGLRFGASAVRLSISSLFFPEGAHCDTHTQSHLSEASLCGPVQ